MHIMAEFYVSEMMVPFGPKAITNVCTSFRRDDTKEGDMIETIAHFKDESASGTYTIFWCDENVVS